MVNSVVEHPLHEQQVVGSIPDRVYVIPKTWPTYATTQNNLNNINRGPPKETLMWRLVKIQWAVLKKKCTPVDNGWWTKDGQNDGYNKPYLKLWTDICT